MIGFYVFERFLAIASSTAFNCLRSSSRLETDLLLSLGGDAAAFFFIDSKSITSFLEGAVETAAANSALDFAFNLGLAAALSSLAFLPRRAPSDELFDDDDERDSLSDSLDEDDESDPEVLL